MPDMLEIKQSGSCLSFECIFVGWTESSVAFPAIQTETQYLPKTRIKSHLIAEESEDNFCTVQNLFRLN